MNKAIVACLLVCAVLAAEGALTKKKEDATTTMAPNLDFLTKCDQPIGKILCSAQCSAQSKCPSCVDGQCKCDGMAPCGITLPNNAKPPTSTQKPKGEAQLKGINNLLDDEY